MKRKKQLIFDLDTNVADRILGKNYKNVYSQIRRFLEKNGFRHIEGSSYVSKTALSNQEVTYILTDLISQYPYLDKCVRDIHQTDVSLIHSKSSMFHYDGKTDDLEYTYNPFFKRLRENQKQKNMSKDEAVYNRTKGR